MEKTTNLKTRALALILTVLMIVGVLPMTVFALKPAENSVPSYDYKKPDIGELIEGLYNSDSKYWTLAVTSSNPSYKPAYSTSANSARLDNGTTNTNGTITVPATANAQYRLGNTRYPGYSADNYKAVWVYGVAGLDLAYEVDIKIDPSMDTVATEGTFGIGPEFTGGYEARRYDSIRVKVSGAVGARKYEVYLPNGLNDALGAKIGEVYTDKTVNFKFVYDVTGHDSAGDTYYVFVDGEYVAANSIANGATLSDGQNIHSGRATQDGWNNAAGTSHAIGPVFYSLAFANKAAIAWTASNANLYYYDDTPDDGNVINASRGPALTYYNDFDGLTVDTQYKSTAADATKLPGTFASVQISNGSGSKNYLKPFEGESGLAIRSNYPGGDGYVDFWPGTAWANMPAYSGKSFVFSADVYGGETYPQNGAIFSFGDRDGTNFMPVIRDKDGSLYLGYYDGYVCTAWSTNSNAMTDAQKAGGYLGKLEKDKALNITVQVNVEDNYFVLYIDGVDVTGKLNLLSDAQKATIASKTNDEGGVKYPNGFALCNVRMNYSGSVFENSIGFDNVVSYFADEVIFNTIPVEPSLKYPDGAKLQEELAKIGGTLMLYTDFNSATAANDGAIKASASHRVNKYGFHSNGATWELIDDGNGGKAINYFNKGNTNLNYYLTSGFRTYPDADTVGKSFVFSADIKAGEKMIDGQLFAFTSYAQTNNNTYNYTAIPLYVKADGTIYVPDASNGIVTILNGWKGNSYYQTIGELSKDEFTNVAVQVNPGENWFKVYVNGVAKTDKLLLANATTLAAYEAANTEVLSGKGYNPTSFSFGYRGGVTTPTHYYIWDNMAFYYSDSYIAPEEVVSGGYTGGYGAFKTPTLADINALYAGDSSYLMRYYQTFDSATLGATNTTVPAPSANASGVGANINAGITWVDDGNGGKAAQWYCAAARNTYYNINNSLSGDREGTKVSGKNFVFSMDIKGGDVYANKNLFVFNAHSFFKANISDMTNIHAGFAPVYVDTDGTLYVGYRNGGMSKSDTAFGITNAIKTESNKILKLSKDKFVNIAVSVNVAANTWSLYVDGMCVRKDLTFISEAYLGTDNSNVNTTKYPNGFGLAYLRIHQNEANTYQNGKGFTIDNVALYEANSYKSGIACDFNGYVAENGGMYYYEDGKIVGNKVSADGMFTIDANGQVFYGTTPVKSLNDYYCFVNGELVPKNGVYSGLYQGDMFTGKAGGNLYYYNVEKNMVTDKAVYDIKDDNAALDGVVGYVIGTDGIITGTLNGMIELANGTRYYVDGVRKTGLFTLDTKTYFAGENDYLATGLQNVGNGVYYFFDATTFEGALRTGMVEEEDGNTYYYKADGTRYTGWFTVSDAQYCADANGVLQTGEQKDAENNPWIFDETTFVGVRDGLTVFNAGAADEYAVLYIMGELQSEDSVASFGTTNPFYYKGNYYYIAPDDGVDGQTELYYDNSGAVITIGGSVYTFNGYIATRVSNSIVDGKYYDENGNLIKDAFFEGLATDGVTTVWYHADTTTGELLTGFALNTVNGLWYNFAAADDATAPYVGTALNGVHKYDFDADANTEDTYRYFENGAAFIGSSKDVDSYTVIVMNNDGDLYTGAATDPKEFITGSWYIAEDANAPYALTLADGVIESVYAGNTEATYRFFQNGVLFAGGAYEIESGVWYAADANGDLFVNESATDPMLIAGMWVVNAGGAPYRGMFADGVFYSDYDADGTKTYRYFVDGVLQTATVEVGGYYYVILDSATGDLSVNEYTDKPNVFGDKWYVMGGTDVYMLAYADGILMTSDKAPADDANEYKLFASGVLNVGDANGEIFDGDALKHKYDENGALYENNDDGVVAADGKTYDFVDFNAVLRDNYTTSKDGFVWVDGYLVTDGIHYVENVEMYFKGGKASAGEVLTPDGAIHVFGPDGTRIPVDDDAEAENKYPHSIKVTVQVKDGDTVTRLYYREFYRLWNTSYVYIPGWYQCYGYSITVNGVEVTAADGEVLKAVIEASDRTDSVIVVTYDKAVDAHTDLVLVPGECTVATCVNGGENVYQCQACDRHSKVTEPTAIDPSNHDLTVVTTPADHSNIGTKVTTCAHGCDYYTIEYIPMVNHVWVEVPGTRVDADCGNNGSVGYACDCGATKTETLYATGAHNYQVFSVTQPTCSESGVTSYVCTVCDDVYTVVVGCNHIHTPNLDTEVKLDSISTEYATYIYDCVVCGEPAIITKIVKLDDDDDENP